MCRSSERSKGERFIGYHGSYVETVKYITTILRGEREPRKIIVNEYERDYRKTRRENVDRFVSNHIMQAFSVTIISLITFLIFVPLSYYPFNTRKNNDK